MKELKFTKMKTKEEIKIEKEQKHEEEMRRFTIDLAIAVFGIMTIAVFF